MPIGSRRCSTIRVAYQGEPGAYSEEAALGYFGAAVDPLPLPTFSTVCAAVLDGRAAAGMLPLENSLAGTVGEAVDALLRARHAQQEVAHRQQHLADDRQPGASLASLRRVRSHRQALAQCERFLAAHDWEVAVADDTAGAARELAAASDLSVAVIASQRAAERYGLAVLAREIADEASNVTRFAVVAQEPPAAAGPLAPAAGAARCSLVVFETLHRPGALHHALGALAEAGVNISRIESRPTGGATWQYRFLVSLDGAAHEEPLRSALAELERRAHAVSVLGSFPMAEAPSWPGTSGSALARSTRAARAR